MCFPEAPNIPEPTPPPQMQEAKDVAALDLQERRRRRNDGSVRPMSIITGEQGDTVAPTTGRVTLLGG